MIAQAAGLGVAVEWLGNLGMENVREYEHELVSLCTRRVERRSGPAHRRPDDFVSRGATISFTLDGIHPHDVAQLLDEQGIAVRAGHHCARPVCLRYGIPATTRASFGVYTTTDEIDALVRGLDRVRGVFAA